MNIVDKVMKVFRRNDVKRRRLEPPAKINLSYIDHAECIKKEFRL